MLFLWRFARVVSFFVNLRKFRYKNRNRRVFRFSCATTALLHFSRVVVDDLLVVVSIE